MKYYVILALLPLLFCSAQKGEMNIFNEKEVEPHTLYTTFTPHEKTLLQKNGFFARKYPERKFSELYKGLKDNSIPIYVTTDCVLHTYHILYDYSLRILEMNYLYPELGKLTDKMIKQTEKLMPGKQGQIKEALLMNLAYFEVAAKLLNPDFEISRSVARVVEQELNLINGAKGIEKSPLFEYREDYSQYIPRGHYTRNEVLKKYFKAMMWYGRMGFRLKPEPAVDNKKGKKQTRGALLIIEAVQDYFEDWQKINSPIILYVGKSDDLTPLEYRAIKNSLFPKARPIEIAADDKKLTRFIDEAMKFRPPKIVSTVVPDTVRPEIATKGMRFYGQKFIPDSYMFQNLVYNKVGTQDNPRLFPRGLDILAVLGSKRAHDILIDVYKENRYTKYESQLDMLVEEFKGIKKDDWYVNLYYGWLYTLSSLLLPVPGFQPAYQDKCLQTALGSWSELRHDTILYAKQSYTLEATSALPPAQMVRGYVEPIPEAYARLKKLVDMSKTELEKSAFLDETVKMKLENFSSVLERLTRIAEHEKANKELTDSDYRFIQYIGGALKELESFPGADYTTETDESAALIADVHTDPNTKQVLEVGNDVPAIIYVVISIDGRPHIFAGGIYDYYEFRQSLTDRLTDEKWQGLSPKPDKPEWIEFFTR
jgi:hypothetical protein